MNPESQRRLALLVETVLRNPYIPKRPHPVTGQSGPTPRQARFLLTDKTEAGYGGAAGGGKSDALLMAALQYARFPGYRALILRRTFTDLNMPGSILNRCHEWLEHTDARWHSKEATYTFPQRHGHPASLTFGYLQHEEDKRRYAGSEFHYIAFDELTQFSESQWTFLLSRLRRNVGDTLPLRARWASNPGGVGHIWVKERFALPHGRPDRPFIPARIADNAFIDREAYIKGLADLPAVLREQLLNGDWNVSEGGSLFNRGWFEVVEPVAMPKMVKVVRVWDFAATDPARSKVPKGHGPAWTAGAKVGLATTGQWYILDLVRLRAQPQGVEQAVRATAARDGASVPVVIEQEPGSGGKNTIDHYRRFILVGYTVEAYIPETSKVARAGPVSSAAEAGNVKLMRGAWNGAFLDEAELFPNGPFKDQVDAVSAGVAYLRQQRSGFLL
jgi:predicted phage terminase large subunit-like protein